MKAHPPIPQVWGKGRCLRLYGCYILIAHDPLALEARLNLYAYAGNNPVMKIDPSGLSFNGGGMISMNDDMLSKAWVNNLNNIDFNRAQMSFERAASNFISVSNSYSSIMKMQVSNVDVKNLRQAFDGTLSMLTEQGMRNSNGYINNISSTVNMISGGYFGSSYLGCIDQSDVMADQLSKIPTDDKWTFTPTRQVLQDWTSSKYLGNIPLPHVRVIGSSSNPKDPQLIIDPWRNTFKEVNKKR